MTQQSNLATSRIAVITGGASGIGPAIGQRLARAGHPVALLDRQGELAHTEAQRLRTDGARVMAAEVDVTDRSAIDQALDRVRTDLGPISIMVTSAGVDVGTPVPATEITAEQWDRLIAINLTGAFTYIQAAIPRHANRRMGPHRHDLLVQRPIRCARARPLVASKGGVIALTKALAYELPRKASPSTPSRRPSSTPPWPKPGSKPNRPAASTFWGPWSPCAAAEHLKTSPPPPPSCAPTTPASSPVKSSASTAACTSEYDE